MEQPNFNNIPVRSRSLRWLTSVFALFVLYTPAFASLPDDPALDKPVTLAAKGEALSDILQMLQQKTGVWLRISRDIADQNATVFVDEKPLRSVMSGLCTVFGYAWRVGSVREHPVYELCRTSASIRTEETNLSEKSDRAWKELLSSLKQSLDLSAKSPAEIDRQLKADVDDELMQDDEFRKLAVDSLSGDETRQLLRFVNGLPESTMNALRSGATVYFDSASPEAAWRLPSDLTSAMIAEQTKPIAPANDEITSDPVDQAADSIDIDDEDASGHDIDPEQAADEFPRMGLDDNEPTETTDRVNYSLHLVEMPGRLGLEGSAAFFAGKKRTFTFGNTVDAVQEFKQNATTLPQLPQTPDSNLMSTKVNWTKAELIKEANLPEHRETEEVFGEVNRSDVLAVLHRKLGVQVIADHYTDWRCIPKGANLTLRSILDDLAESNGPMSLGRSDYKATWGADNQFIYFRTDDPTSDDPWEVPNRLLRPWQSKYAQRHSLDLSDYAQMALLTAEQRDTLTRCCQRLCIGHPDTFGTSCYDNGESTGLLWLPVIRLYGLLSDRQRKEAAMRGAPIAAFTADQMAELSEIIAAQRQKKSAPDISVRVGIYLNGLRVDKPGRPTQDGPSPTLFEFRLAKSYTDYCREIISSCRIGGQDGESVTSANVKASSFEQAWEKVKGKIPVTQKHLLYRTITQTYRAKIAFDDGTTLGTWPEIISRLNFDEYETDKQAAQHSKQPAQQK